MKTFYEKIMECVEQNKINEAIILYRHHFEVSEEEARKEILEMYKELGQTQQTGRHSIPRELAQQKRKAKRVQEKQRGRRIGGIALLVMGAMMVVGAFFWYTDVQSFLSNATITEGKIIDVLVEPSPDSDGVTDFYPLVTFTTQEGNEVIFKDLASIEETAFQKGEIVSVAYEVDKPKEARINDFWLLHADLTILGILGSIMSFFGAVLYTDFFEKKPKYR